VALNIFSKSPAAIGQVCSTATTFRAYPEQIMTWNIFLVSGDIINVVVLDAALASPTAVIRGSVQLVAAIATQLQAPRASDLSVSRSAWQQVRTQLKNINNNGFNSDNSDVLPLRICLWAETSPASATQKKNKIWLWSAVNNGTAGILAWVLGDRSADTFKLCGKLSSLGDVFFMDGYRFIPVLLTMLTI